jgi:hypothetical protein
MDTRMNGHESDVVQLRRASAPANDQLDTAGQTILQLIDRAAGVAEENSKHAMEMSQRTGTERVSRELQPSWAPPVNCAFRGPA